MNPSTDPATERPGANRPREDAPRPLHPGVPPESKFPIEALPEPLRDAVLAIHDIVQAPLTICVQSVLAAATLAVQGHADVELPIGSMRPIVEDFVTIAESGDRKTTADDLALQPVRDREMELEAEYEVALKRFHIEEKAWMAQRDQILRMKKDNPSFQDKKLLLTELGLEPSRPPMPTIICGDPTIEGMIRLLNEGSSSIGIFSSEGGQFLGGFSMAQERRLHAAAVMAEVWDGKELKRIRAGGEMFTLRGRRVSMHLQVQPSVALDLLADPVVEGQGLTTRILAVMPRSLAGTRFQRTPQPKSFSNLSRFSGVILSRLQTKLPAARQTQGALNPRRLALAALASKAWCEFADEVEGKLGPGGPFEQIRPFANKAAEHSARLAAILTLICDLNAPEVPLLMMEAGITLVRFYLSERLRIQAWCTIDAELQLVEKVLDWILNVWKEPNDLISLPDLYQRGPAKVRDKETAERILSILTEHGSLQECIDGTGKGIYQVNGNARTKVWRIIRPGGSAISAI